MDDTDTDIQQLALDGWHRARGARMVSFAGYSMPVQYEGVIAEHLWTRTSAGLFDVSHMGQLIFHGGDADAAIDPLSDPKIRDAVARATFEHLVGFQLSQDQLRYNATR